MPLPTSHSSPPIVLRKLGIAVVVLLIAVAIGEIAGWPFLRVPLAQQIAARTGATVALDGRFRVQLLINPGMAVESVTIGPSSAIDVPHLLQADGFVVGWRWLDLLRARSGGALRLKRLEAEQIDAHLIRLANGDNSWAPPQSQARGEASVTALPQIESLVLHAGDVVYRDEILDIDLKVHITQREGAEGILPWRAIAKGRYHGAKVDLDAQAGADLPLLMQSKNAPALTPLRLSGQIGSTKIDFDGATGALWAGQGMRGTISLRGASLRTSGKALGITLPDTPPYRLQGRIERNGAVWSLATDDATVGTSSLTANMQFDTATEPPRLSGRVGGRRLAFADLGPAIGAGRAPGDASRVLPDEHFDLPGLKRMDADVQVDLAQLDFGTLKLAPITDLKLQVSLAGSQLRLQDLSARVAGGLLTGSTRLHAEQQPPAWDAALSFTEVNLKHWIRALQKDAESASADPPAYLSGTLGAKVSLSGKGNSVAEILGSANGKLSVEVADGQISQFVTEAIGLDAAQALGLLIAGDRPLDLNCARAEAVIEDGVLKTRHAMLDNVDSTLHIQGGASLKSEELRLRVIAEPKDFSPLSLRSPLNIAGTFKSPQVSVEASGLLARAAGALLLGALAPPAAILAFIDIGTAPDTEPCAPIARRGANTD